jgi:glutamate synthase (NADPH/NADH) large chain
MPQVRPDLQALAQGGLYDARHEHDACGLGFVADLKGGATHRTVEMGLEILKRLAHRGAAGSDPLTGDGAGILVQIPHRYFERVLDKEGKEIPPAGDYGVASCFLSRDPAKQQLQMKTLVDVARYHNQKVVGWRDVPVSAMAVGATGRASMPVMKQLFIARIAEKKAFERTLFMIRKRAGKIANDKGFSEGFYVASCSSKTIVYKGLMLPERLAELYRDLASDDFESQIALVHSRFSTNTFPTWERAHPYRRIAHNGEINTLRGNQNWMRAREALLESRLFSEISYGARAITTGGIMSLPQTTFPGGALVGCDAGYLNGARIKGSHAAIKSGMLCAEAAFEAVQAGRQHDEPATRTACRTSSRSTSSARRRRTRASRPPW